MVRIMIVMVEPSQEKNIDGGSVQGLLLLTVQILYDHNTADNACHSLPRDRSTLLNTVRD